MTVSVETTLEDTLLQAELKFNLKLPDGTEINIDTSMPCSAAVVKQTLLGVTDGVHQVLIDRGWFVGAVRDGRLS